MHSERNVCLSSSSGIYSQAVRGAWKEHFPAGFAPCCSWQCGGQTAGLFVSQLDNAFFSWCYFFSYCKTIFLPLHYLSQSAISALPFASLHNFPWWFLPACMKFDCMKPSLIWTGTVLPHHLCTHSLWLVLSYCLVTLQIIPHSLLQYESHYGALVCS